MNGGRGNYNALVSEEFKALAGNSVKGTAHWGIRSLLTHILSVL